jgi:hypothetical protein
VTTYPIAIRGPLRVARLRSLRVSGTSVRLVDYPRSTQGGGRTLTWLTLLFRHASARCRLKGRR